MYSPKICEALIPQIYRAAKARRMPMTSFVNEILSWALCEMEKGGDNQNDQQGSSGG